MWLDLSRDTSVSRIVFVCSSWKISSSFSGVFIGFSRPGPSWRAAALSVSLYPTSLPLPPQRGGKKTSGHDGSPLLSLILSFIFLFPPVFPRTVTEIPHGFSPGPWVPCEAVSSVMDDVLITVSSTLDRFGKGGGRQEICTHTTSLAVGGGAPPWPSHHHHHHPGLPKEKDPIKYPPLPKLPPHSFHPFTLVTLIESPSLLPNVSALQRERAKTRAPFARQPPYARTNMSQISFWCKTNDKANNRIIYYDRLKNTVLIKYFRKITD